MTRILVSFGTIVWKYFTAEALDAMEQVSRFVRSSPDTEAVISLGRAAVSDLDVARLRVGRVEVVDFLDQHRTLDQVDVFMTHHGLNSTHEAVLHRVPMVSYPFFGDQPSMADQCQQLGLAVPLHVGPRAPLTPEDIDRAVLACREDAAQMADRLAEARLWELETVAGRPAIINRILALI